MGPLGSMSTLLQSRLGSQRLKQKTSFIYCKSNGSPQSNVYQTEVRLLDKSKVLNIVWCICQLIWTVSSITSSFTCSETKPHHISQLIHVVRIIKLSSSRRWSCDQGGSRIRGLGFKAKLTTGASDRKHCCFHFSLHAAANPFLLFITSYYKQPPCHGTALAGPIQPDMSVFGLG